MTIRFYLPTDEQPVEASAKQSVLTTLAGKSILFISNWRSRNDEIEEALREVLVGRMEAKGLTRLKVNHGRPEPKAKLAPLVQQYDAVIGAFGG